MFSRPRGGIEMSLAECRPAAALPIFRKRNFKPERFQHFNCGNSNVRFVITHKCIIPKDDLASVVAAIVDRGTGVTAPGYSMFMKPAIESFPGVMRQRASSRKAE